MHHRKRALGVFWRIPALRRSTRPHSYLNFAYLCMPAAILVEEHSAFTAETARLVLVRIDWGDAPPALSLMWSANSRYVRKPLLHCRGDRIDRKRYAPLGVQQQLTLELRSKENESTLEGEDM